jgi:hypothetical protein
MFDSPFHDPKADWRYQPASERQRARLNELGIPCGSVTKGQASDMLSAVQPPGIDEIEFLEFFGVSDAATLSQLDARKKIALIIADPDPENRIKWNNRPATLEQIALIQHFGGASPSDLTWCEADGIIKEKRRRRPQTTPTGLSPWVWIVIVVVAMILLLRSASVQNMLKEFY